MSLIQTAKQSKLMEWSGKANSHGGEDMMATTKTELQGAPLELIEEIPSIRPWDKNNSRWVENVHPLGWTNPEPTRLRKTIQRSGN